MILSLQERILPGASIRERFAVAARVGFGGIEIQGRPLLAAVDEYRRCSEETGLPITTICAGWDGALLDPRPAERERAVQGIIALLQLGDRLGGAHLVAPPHFGAPRLPDLSPLKTVVELEDQLLVALLSRIGAAVAGLRSRVLLEPVNRLRTHYLTQLEHAFRLADAVGSANVGVMADVFHMQLSEDHTARRLRQYGGRLGHVHLADSNRNLPGQGQLDFTASFVALREAGYQGAVALETEWEAESEASLRASMEFLTQHSDSLVEPVRRGE